MRIRVSFSGEITVHGGKVSRDVLIEAVEMWLEEQTFIDSIVDYIDDEHHFDHMEFTIEKMNVS